MTSHYNTVFRHHISEDIKCSYTSFCPEVICQKKLIFNMDQETRDSSKQLEKTRYIDEYSVPDPIVKYDPELVRNSLAKVIIYLVKYYIRN